MDVVETNVPSVSLLPNRQRARPLPLASSRNPVPVTVTGVPPPGPALAGVTLSTTGGLTRDTVALPTTRSTDAPPLRERITSTEAIPSEENRGTAHSSPEALKANPGESTVAAGSPSCACTNPHATSSPVESSPSVSRETSDPPVAAANCGASRRPVHWAPTASWASVASTGSSPPRTTTTTRKIPPPERAPSTHVNRPPVLRQVASNTCSSRAPLPVATRHAYAYGSGSCGRWPAKDTRTGLSVAAVAGPVVAIEPAERSTMDKGARTAWNVVPASTESEMSQATQSWPAISTTANWATAPWSQVTDESDDAASSRSLPMRRRRSSTLHGAI